MEKNVRVTITSRQTLDGETGKSISKENGEYYKRGNYHYIIYKEQVPESVDHISNMIKWNEHTLEVQKRGAISSHMIFKLGVETISEYTLPYGMTLLTILTREYSQSLTDNQADIKVGYDLTIEGQGTTKCQIEILAK